MTVNQQIEAVFSILHDGTIISWGGDKKQLTLTVDCKYLAEQIDKSFDRFYLELSQIDELYFSTWPNPFDLPVQTLTKINEIFKAELEILTADIIDSKVVIAFSLSDKNFDYCGGNLTISCSSIKVFDQKERKVTFEELVEKGKDYWDEKRKK